MAYAIQPVKENLQPFQRSPERQPSFGFRKWMAANAAGNDAVAANEARANLAPITTSLEDFLILAQQDLGPANHTFAPHAQIAHTPYDAFALPSDIESDGQYMFEFLMAAPANPGEKINEEI